MIAIGTFLRSSRVGQALQPVRHVDSPPWASLEARDAVPDPAAVVRSCLPYAGSGGNSARSISHRPARSRARPHPTRFRRANSMAGRGSLRGGNEAQGAATVSALATVTRTIQPCNADSSTRRSRLRLILAHLLLLGRPFRLGRRLCR